MGVSGTYQFVWSSLSGAVGARFPATSPAALGTVFTLFVVAQTLTQFPAGRIRDRYGPRNILLVAAALLAVGYAGIGLAGSFPVVVVAYTLGGVGSGITYTVAVNTPVKWVPEEGRRGLATGLVTMAYSGTSVLFIPVLRGSLDDSFTTALLVLGGVVGVGGLLGAWILRDPPGVAADGGADPGTDSGGAGTTAAEDPATGSGAATAAEAGVGWRTAVRTWQFWVLYGVLTAVSGVGLMLVGQSVGFTTGLGLSAATATTVASAVALGDAAGVLVVSALSDRLGGERTVGVSLVFCGCTLVASVVAGSHGLEALFVVLVAAAAFFRSPVFGIFPTLVADYYGTARSSENYATLYTAKLPGGVVGGTVTGALVAGLGWSRSFVIGGVVLVLAGFAALSLRPTSVGSEADGDRAVDD